MSSANVCRWFAVAALCFVCTGFSQSASAADGKKLALLVGVDKYAEGSGFRPLPYTERDVEQLAAILIKSGYRPEDVRVLTIKRGNEDTRFFPSFRNIRREFDLLAKGRKPTDSLLVALSGHGIKRNDKGSSPGAFFCPLDADITDPTTLISLASLYDMLKESRAAVKVMLVDACQNDPTEGKSGAIPFSPPPPPPSVAALFACSDGEVAWDARDLGGGHGVFFHYVIEGLKGQADTDHNNQVTLAELAAYTEEKVPDYVSRMKSKRQTPYLESSGGKIALLDIPRTTSRWVPLFNGKDLAGWKTHPSQRGDWRVEDGVMIGSGPHVSHIYTERGDYRDFRLLVEARINDGGNSGVLFRSHFGPDRPTNRPSWPSGYEAQINTTHRDPKRTGSLIGAGPLVVLRESPISPRQWFSLEVIAQGNHIVINVNGKTTADYTDENRHYSSGHIAVQQLDPATLAEFRKIEIQELNGTR